MPRPPQLKKRAFSKKTGPKPGTNTGKGGGSGGKVPSFIKKRMKKK